MHLTALIMLLKKLLLCSIMLSYNIIHEQVARLSKEGILSGAEAEDQGLEPATEALELCYLFAGCSNSV